MSDAVGEACPVPALPVTACPVCGGSGQPWAADRRDTFPDPVPGRWDYLRCERCASLWISPCPLADAIPGLYRGYYTHAAPALGFLDAGGLRCGRFRLSLQLLALARHYAYASAARFPGHELSPPLHALAALCLPFLRRRSGRLVRYLEGREGARLLDVGCGNGTFLLLMKRLGWNAVGIEPDARAAAAARGAGLEVLGGRIEDAELADGSFDAITLSHVLEHLPAPPATLARLYRLLAPGGVLISISPNPQGLPARLFRGAWYHLDPPRHLVIPGPAGYRAMLAELARNGAMTSIFCAPGELPWSIREGFSISRTGVIGQNRGWMLAKILAYLIFPALGLLVRDWGDEVVCIVRKPER